MDFRSQYLAVLKQRAPKLYLELWATQQLSDHIERKMREAYEYRSEAIAYQKGKGIEVDPNLEHMIEEVVFAEMCDFPRDT